jgi:mRNA interferase RelE/StbE
LAYKVVLLEQAIEDLSSLDKQIAQRILYKVGTHLTKSPDTNGKPLKGEFSGFYRYRIVDWRVIYYLEQDENTLTVTRVRHRKKVYKE